MRAAIRSGTRGDASRLSEDPDQIDLVVRKASDRQHDSPEAAEINKLGLHVKEVIATISRLESLGLQRMEIPLPKCIVLGEQSAGKSSVIEAISGIKTPRSDDTCTRCPLFIKLEPSEDPRASWSASVGLRRSFNYDGKIPRGKSRDRDRRFPGWCEMTEPTFIPFGTTDDPDKLEQLIARAQLATVSPLVDYQTFLAPSTAVSGQDYHSCEFSPNVVCISITQPEIPALSFYDLPGIIGQAENEENEFVVKFVTDLVTDYVKDPETLILLCCSLETDIANSNAGGIARMLRATDRCIGVLTKPDRLPPGSRNHKLVEVFEQKRFALGHGYFVVKNLSQDEINQGLTHQQARAREQDFFNNDPIWSTEFKSYAHRFGTLNLQRFLSEKLAEQSIKKLPVIEQEIEARLHQVEVALEQYPEPPTHNATRIILDVLLDFSQEVRREIEAEYPYKHWRNNWRALQKAFFDALVSMKPTMCVLGAEDASVYFDIQAALPGASAKEPMTVSESENSGNDDNEDSETAASNSASPKKKRKLADRGKTPTQRGPPAPPAEVSGMPADFSDLRRSFKLDDVRQHLAENSQSRIPGQIEPRVINSMMLETIQHWKKPLDRFLDTLGDQMQEQVHGAFEKHFRNREGSAFHVEAWRIVEALLRPNTTMAHDSLRDETQGPYIFHEDVFEREKNATLEYYQQCRLRARLHSYKTKKEQRTKKAVTPAEEEKIKKHCLSVLRAEPYELEVGVVAQVTTYYMLAARRFHDAVCMRVESDFFTLLSTRLRYELEDGLGLTRDGEGLNNAMRLLEEPSHRFNQRRELLAQRNALVQGQKILWDLQQKYGVAEPVAKSKAGGETA